MNWDKTVLTGTMASGNVILFSTLAKVYILVADDCIAPLM